MPGNRLITIILRLLYASHYMFVYNLTQCLTGYLFFAKVLTFC